MVLITRATRERVRTDRVRTDRVRTNSIDDPNAALKSYAISLGCVGLFNMRDPDGLVRSGSDVSAIVELINGTSHATNGSTAPQYSANGLVARPAVTFASAASNYVSGTTAGILAALDDASPHTLVMHHRHASGNYTGFQFSVGRLGTSTNSRRRWGHSASGSALIEQLAVNASGSTTGTVIQRTGIADTSAHIDEWFGSTTTTFYRDGVGQDLGSGAGVAVAFDPGTLTPTHWLIGANVGAGNNPASFFNGALGVLAIFPSVLTSDQRSELRRIIRSL